MTNDKEGFLVPQIDEALCTGCKVCVDRCPENNNSVPFAQENKLPKVFGVKLKNDAVLKMSASGGVFSGIALKILESSGNAVFGCAFDENIVAKHICITNAKYLEPIQSSKYVQSDTGNTFSQAKHLLDSGKTVFYTGCPCQIAGLYAYLDKDYDNLLTAELICHGVPSPLLFKKYILWLEKKYGEKVHYYNFRTKDKHGWGLMTKVMTKSKTKFIDPNADPYFNSFLENKTFRECCYTCKYATQKRVGDITLGDFWGVKKFHPEFYDQRGISIVLINSDKGERFFRDVYNDFDIVVSSMEKAVTTQHNLKSPSHRHSLRGDVYKDINNDSVDIFASAELRPSKKKLIKVYLKQGIKLITPRFVLKLYKKCKAQIFR